MNGYEITVALWIAAAAIVEIAYRRRSAAQKRQAAEIRQQQRDVIRRRAIREIRLLDGLDPRPTEPPSATERRIVAYTRR